MLNILVHVDGLRGRARRRRARAAARRSTTCRSLPRAEGTAGTRSGGDRRAPRRSTPPTAPSGAKLVPFGGWDMPLQYPSGHARRAPRPAAPPRWCSTSATSAPCASRGPTPSTGCRPRFTNDLGKIGAGPGAVHAPARRGRRLGARRHHRVVGRRRALRRHAQRLEHRPGRRRARGRGDGRHRRRGPSSPCRGPRPARRLAAVVPEAAAVGRFRVARIDVVGRRRASSPAPATRARTASSSRCPAERRRRLWDAVLGAGVEPAGLGARDTLRLEAGLPLHGHELGPGITPLQAGLGWVVRWDKGDFRAATPLAAEKERGVARRLRGMAIEGRRPPAGPSSRSLSRRRTPSARSPAATSRRPSATASPWPSSRPTSRPGVEWPSTSAAPRSRPRSSRPPSSRSSELGGDRRTNVRRSHPSSVSPRTRRPGGRCTPGCGRRSRRRCGGPAASTCRPRSTRAGEGGLRPGEGVVPLVAQDRLGACQRRVPGAARAAASISARMAIIASQNRSISPRSSDSVGSIISVPAHREAHRRGVEAVVDEPLGHVVDGDAGVLGDRAQVDDALVGDQPVPARVEHGVVRRPGGGRCSWR